MSADARDVVPDLCPQCETPVLDYAPRVSCTEYNGERYHPKCLEELGVSSTERQSGVDAWPVTDSLSLKAKGPLLGIPCPPKRESKMTPQQFKRGDKVRLISDPEVVLHVREVDPYGKLDGTAKVLCANWTGYGKWIAVSELEAVA